jgi:hypothetical protein
MGAIEMGQVDLILEAHRLALKYPRLTLAALRYGAIAPKFTLVLHQRLLGIAQVLAILERKSPSGSGRQVRSRANSVVSAAFQAGILGDSPGSATGTNAIDGDVAELAVIIMMMMMIQDGDNELEQQMANARSEMQAKQAIRAMLEAVNEAAGLATSFPEYSVPPWSLPLQSNFMDALETIARSIR